MANVIYNNSLIIIYLLQLTNSFFWELYLFFTYFYYVSY